LLDEKPAAPVIPKDLLPLARGLLDGPLDPGHWGLQPARQRAGLLDDLLRDLFVRSTPPSRAVLAAVGSYGRRTLALGSDVDLRILTDDRDEGARLADALLYPLWDARIQVGHQVVTREEILDLAASDLPTATSLLDWRFLAGDEETSRDLLRDARRLLLDPPGVERLTGWLEEESRARHERFGGSVYLLEPDVKSGEGGLRDLDILGWLSLARSGLPAAEALAQEALAAPAEIRQLHEAQELLARVRNLLHAAARRRQDRLTFEHQEALAPRLGYEEQARAMLGSRGSDQELCLAVAVEAFMSDYYRHAQVIARVLERLLRRGRPRPAIQGAFVPEPSPWLHPGDGHLEIPEELDLRRHPWAALRVYHEATRLGLPVGTRSRERIAQATHDEEFTALLRSSPESARIFLDLCVNAAETPQLGRSVMSELREVGLLVAMIPEFAPVVGRVHHDVYHVYTVDVHSVAALDRLKELVRGDLAASYPLACRLAAEEIQPEVLHLATLLHDVGKALGGHDHASRGAAMSLAIARRLGLPEERCERVAHLVQMHLVLYHTATKRDLDDPASLDELLPALRGRENLRELYLLTVADISTTSPTALTAWKAKLLEDLYRAADARLLGLGQDDDLTLRRSREAALALAGPPAFARSFLASMPPRYLLGTPPEAVAAHIQLAAGASESGLACGLRPSPVEGLAELCVVTFDRPGLLAAITAAIAACRLEIHGAQILSHPLDDGREQAVDLFWVRCASPEQIPRLQSLLDAQLDAFVRGRTPLESFLTPGHASPRLARHTPAISTEVFIDDRSSPSASIVEVVTRDRPGVLCALALAFHRLDLSVSLARINTEGTRVADVFYVTNNSGSKIELLPRKDEIKERITDILSALAPP
jgi:[protein-PII] uridylyltransferase